MSDFSSVKSINNKVLPFKASGNKESKYAIIFTHGWPDTITLFDKYISFFSKDFYVVQLSYPNFVPEIKSTWGLDLDQTVEYMNNTLNIINDIKNKEKIFISHDWGCLITYMFDFKYPNNIKAIIALDVGAKHNISWYLMAYQLYLSVAFLLGGFIGNFMTKVYLKSQGYDPKWKYDSSVNSFYYYKWKEKILNIFKRKSDELDSYKPSCPILFLYGTKKPFMSHNDEWIRLLENSKDSQIKSFDSGHWFFQKFRQDIVNLIKDFLKPKL